MELFLGPLRTTLEAQKIKIACLHQVGLDFIFFFWSIFGISRVMTHVFENGFSLTIDDGTTSVDITENRC